MPRRLSCFLRDAALRPGRGLIHFGANVDHQKCGQSAYHKHSTPAHEAEYRPVNQGRHEIADRVAFLQYSGEESASLRRERFERQRRAHAPFPAHRDPEQRPRDQENFQRRGEGRRQFKHRVGDDIDHQCGTPPEAVRHHAEKKCADRTKSQGDEDRLRDGGDFRLELSRDGADAKSQNEEIKSVERPAQKAGDKCIPLDRRKPPKMADKFH